MIRFACRCGHLFEEPDDSAGLSVQCPGCRLLNDIPSFGDMENIGLDGTYSVDARSSRSSPDQLDDTLKVFSSAKSTPDDEAIDLRTQAGEIDEIVGEVETPEQMRRRLRPRYDPETGELIQAIPFAGEGTAGMATPPIPFAKAAVTYEADGALHSRGLATVMLDLVQPLNLLVLFFVLVIHCFFFAALAALAVGLFIIVPVLAGLIVVLLAHYPNVIDEIGVDEQNELPRVLRDLRMYEDVWWPSLRTVTALALSYGPAVAALFLPVEMSKASSLAVVLGLIGTWFFPAIILTLQTSGTLANLRPDRVLGVIRQIRSRYFALVMTFVLAIVPYALAMVSLSGAVIEVNPFGIRAPVPIAKIPIAGALLIIGIFMMHAFCWELGLIYRTDSARFPWVGRFHVREPRKPVVRRKPRYVGNVPARVKASGRVQ